MSIELNPIQKQMFMMAKLFLKKNRGNIVYIKTTDIKTNKVSSFSFSSNNLNDLLEKIIEHKTGIISFYYHSHKTSYINSCFEFIYSYEQDVVSFTPLKNYYGKDVLELFSEAEFLVQVNFDEFFTNPENSD
jgi:hypothetical protein